MDTFSQLSSLVTWGENIIDHFAEGRLVKLFIQRSQRR